MGVKLAYDLTGKRFGEWTAIRHLGVSGGRTRWLCRCSCGTEKVIDGRKLRLGMTRNCRGHKMTTTPEHETWRNMIQRCHCPTANAYSRYGGRGISVCKRWRNSFASFLSDMGERPSDRHSIERRKNDGNYEPENCYWATPEQQSRNRRNSRVYTWNGVTLCLSEWSRITGIADGTIRARIRSNWTMDDVFSKPVDKRKSTNHGPAS